MWDFDHLYNSLSEDICRYVSKDTNFQWVKCNVNVGISIYTFALSIHFFDIFGGIQHFPSHPQQQPIHEFCRYCARGKSAFSLTPTKTARQQIICIQALSHRLSTPSTSTIHCPTNSQLPSTAIPSLFQRHSVSLPTRFWLPSNSILIPSRTPPFLLVSCSWSTHYLTGLRPLVIYIIHYYFMPIYKTQ